MDLVISSFPGFAFACSVLFFILGGVEAYIYYNTAYKRSLNISLFCFLSSFYALEQFVAHSRGFSALTVYYFCMFAQMALMLATCFYIRAMGYYVVYTHWFYRVSIYSLSLLCLLFSFFIPYNLITGKILYVKLQDFKTSGSYFYDSYMMMGTPTMTSILLMTTFSLISVFVSVNLLRMVWRGSRDRFLMIGLVFSILAVLYQFVLLPLTLKYYVPLVFIANLFEALRMSFLSVREDILDKSEIKPNSINNRVLNSEEKYQNSSLDIERIEELANKLKAVMIEQKPYLDPNLRLDDLAKKIGIPSYQLTQVIKINFNQSFNDYINRYRVEIIKDKFRDENLKSKSIIELAYESGFNSKSTFNMAFKKFTSKTPSEFRKSL